MSRSINSNYIIIGLAFATVVYLIYKNNTSQKTSPTPSPTIIPSPTPTISPSPTPTISPSPTPKPGMIIDSIPQGADVYVLYGPYAGKYLGKTPLIYDPTLGDIWIKFVKPGYVSSMTLVYSWMPSKTNIIVQVLSPVRQ